MDYIHRTQVFLAALTPLASLRYFEREVNSGARLLRVVRNDLNDVMLICRAEKKQTNYHRLMVSTEGGRNGANI